MKKHIVSIFLLILYLSLFTFVLFTLKKYNITSITLSIPSIICLFLVFIVLTKSHLKTYIESYLLKHLDPNKTNYKVLLFEFSQNIIQSKNLNEVAQQLYQLIHHKLNFKEVSIYFPKDFDKKQYISNEFLCHYTSPNSNKNKHIEPAIIKILQSKNEILIASTSMLTSINTQNSKSIEHYLCCFNNKKELLSIITIGKNANGSVPSLEDIHLFSILSTQLTNTLQQIKQNRLSAQIDLAKNIQNELIPNKFNLDGCTVETHFQATDEIGGDYYDIFKKNKHTWIILGDISGHGIGSGLIMFMVQSIFSSLIHTIDVQKPSTLNKLANTILCENFKRLTDPRPMTIATLYTNNGNDFFIHGSHETIFIYEKQTNQTKHIQLTQIPFGIGLTEDIDNKHFNDTSFSLNEGDILLMCTDGIIEATQKGNSSEIEYGEERLISILNAHAKSNVSVIKEKIISDIAMFSNNKLADDFSIILIKKNESTQT